MTALELLAFRRNQGWTQGELAALLRLGPLGRRTVERWEGGGIIPGPALVALAALADGWRPSP